MEGGWRDSGDGGWVEVQWGWRVGGGYSGDGGWVEVQW